MRGEGAVSPVLLGELKAVVLKGSGHCCLEHLSLLTEAKPVALGPTVRLSLTSGLHVHLAAHCESWPLLQGPNLLGRFEPKEQCLHCVSPDSLVSESSAEETSKARGGAGGQQTFWSIPSIPLPIRHPLPPFKLNSR